MSPRNAKNALLYSLALLALAVPFLAERSNHDLAAREEPQRQGNLALAMMPRR